MSNKDHTLIRAMELVRSNWLHATHILREAADNDPDDPSYQIAMGDIFASRSSFDKAIQHYLAALSLDPSNQQVIGMIANSYLSSGEYRLALAYYQKLLHPGDDLLYNKALSQAFLGKHEDCIETLLQILPRFPSHPFIYYLLVEQYFYKGDSMTALKYIGIAKEKAGEHVQLYLLNALIYTNLNQYLQAYHQYLKADSMSPITNSDHLLGFAKSANECGMWQDALKIYERITVRYPYISEAWGEIIKIYLDRDNYIQAKRYLNKAKSKLQRPSSVIRLLQKRLDGMS